MKIRTFVAAVLSLTLYLSVSGAAVPDEAYAGIGAPLPPRLFIPAPPPVVVIPGTYAYRVPDIDADLIFYRDQWYRPHAGRWYVSDGYNGPWAHIEVGRVPRPLIGLPAGFRNVPPGHERIPYGQLKKNWKTWEKERRWDRHEQRKASKPEHMHKEKKGKGKGKRWGD